MRWWVAVLVLAAWGGLSAPARAAPQVDVALVLLTDVSRSVHDGEFELMKRGYAAALNDKDVIAAIEAGPVGAVAIAYVEFAGAGEVRTVVDWTVIAGAADARDFAARVAAAPRSFWGRTAIGDGIDHAMRAFAAAELEATRRVIDVCGDGTSNAGREVHAARDEAVKAGVTINGLAIINDRPTSWTFAHVQPPGGLPNWYRENVTGGPGSFVLEIHDFASFGEAMRRKLLSEIAQLARGPRL